MTVDREHLRGGGDEANFTSLCSTLPTEIDSEDFYGNPCFFLLSYTFMYSFHTLMQDGGDLM